MSRLIRKSSGPTKAVAVLVSCLRGLAQCTIWCTFSCDILVTKGERARDAHDRLIIEKRYMAIVVDSETLDLLNLLEGSTISSFTWR